MPPFILGMLILIVSFILQVTISSYLRIAGAQPDFILIVVVIYAFIKNPFAGSVAGFCGGLLEDLASIQFVGLNALSKTIIGYLSGLLEKTVFAETAFLSMVAIFIATILNQVLYMGLLFLVGNPVPFFVTLWRIVLPSAIYNSLLSPLIYFALLKFVIRGERKPQLVEMLKKSPRIRS